MKKLEKKFSRFQKKKMKNKLDKIAKDTNNFLKEFIDNQKKSNLIIPMKYDPPSNILFIESLGKLFGT